MVYRVQDAGVQKLIRYKPEGHSRVTFQEIVLAKGMTADKRAACTRVMSGRLAPTPTKLKPAAPLQTAAAGGGPVAAAVR
jgi:hypothetical protein